MQQHAVKSGVPLHFHTVIYKLMEQLKEELSSRLPPLISHNVHGESWVRTTTTRVSKISPDTLDWF